MNTTDEGQLVEVNVGSCRCPGTPHTNGDTVSLHPRAGTRLGLAVNGAIAAAAGDPTALSELMGMAFLRLGIASWTFLDDRGRPVPVSSETIEQYLAWNEGGSIVYDKADELYSEAVLSPLVAKLPKPSNGGPTGSSTSAPPPSSPKRPSSSKSSSPESSEEESTE